MRSAWTRGSQNTSKRYVNKGNSVDTINNVQEDNAKKVYVNVELSCKNLKMKCRALVDKGNTVTARSVITNFLQDSAALADKKLGPQRLGIS